MDSVNRELMQFLRAVKAAAPFPERFDEAERDAICEVVGDACLIEVTEIAIQAAQTIVKLVEQSTQRGIAR